MKQRNNESAVVMGVLQNPPDEKPNPGKEAAKEAKPSRAAEVRRTIEEYANNLREIIKKLGAPQLRPSAWNAVSAFANCGRAVVAETPFNRHS